LNLTGHPVKLLLTNPTAPCDKKCKISILTNTDSGVQVPWNL